MEDKEKVKGRPPIASSVLEKIDKHLRAKRSPAWVVKKVAGAKLGKVYERRRALQRSGEIE